MKIESVRIENFRSFRDETVQFSDYTCFVGANGAGKSNVLAALNVFFQERASTTDVSKLVDEDFFGKDTSERIRITITFSSLSDAAKADLADYVRGGRLVVSAEAVFDPASGTAEVRHFGQRLGIDAFREFFAAEKQGAKAPELAAIYDRIRQQFPDLANARSKDEKIQALRDYESRHPDNCVLIASEDNFYGINSTGKIGRHLQWVYVPAVKDAREESIESKNSALGKLVSRVVRTRVNFEREITELRTDAFRRYQEILDRNRQGLDDLSRALQARLESWAHQGVVLGMDWQSDPAKAVSVLSPMAGIRAGESGFLGSLARLGHGLQRSYLIALLQELSATDSPDAPALLFACEEPELYQHPPQARYLADVFGQLAEGRNQIVVTTHSPFFIRGDGFEDVRIVRRDGTLGSSRVSGAKFDQIVARVRGALGEDVARPIQGRVAKLHQALQPSLGEMFFSRVPIFVEGLEDVAFIAAELQLSGMWGEFRRLGCHLVPVNGKERLIQPIAVACELQLPMFVVFDADGNETENGRRQRHQRDNRAIFRLLGVEGVDFPVDIFWGDRLAVWPTDLGAVVRSDIGPRYQGIVDEVRNRYGNEAGLDKQELFIADWVCAARESGCHSENLQVLCQRILDYARQA